MKILLQAFAVLVVLLGLLFVYLGVQSVNRYLAVKENGREITGEIVNVERTTSTERRDDGRLRTSTTYTATVAYTEPGSGSRLTFEQSLLSGQDHLKTGDVVTLDYAPGDEESPHTVALSGTLVLWRTLVPFVAAALFLLAAYALRRTSKRI